VHRFTQYIVLCLALAATDGRRPPAPAPTMRAPSPPRHREGATMFAGHRRPHHVVGI
jgi:hypothetical protein